MNFKNKSKVHINFNSKSLRNFIYYFKFYMLDFAYLLTIVCALHIIPIKYLVNKYLICKICQYLH